LGDWVARSKTWIVTERSGTHLEARGRQTRLLKAVSDLSNAFALAVPHDEAIRIRDDVGFFQAVRAVLAKAAAQQNRPAHALDHAIRQIVSRSVFSGEVVDIFAAAGLKKPDISILSEEFLAEVSHLPQKNLAVEMLRKLLTDEIKTRSRRNVVKSRLFSELLEGSIRKYQNRAIQAAQVIEELIGLAKQMREETAKAKRWASMKTRWRSTMLWRSTTARLRCSAMTRSDHCPRASGNGPPEHDD